MVNMIWDKKKKKTRILVHQKLNLAKSTILDENILSNSYSFKKCSLFKPTKLILQKS